MAKRSVLRSTPSLVESLEARRLLSTTMDVGPTAAVDAVRMKGRAQELIVPRQGADRATVQAALNGAVSPTVAAAFARAADLRQYGRTELAAATQWVFVAEVDAAPRELAGQLGARLVTPSGVLPGVFVASFARGGGATIDSFQKAEIAAYYPVVSLDRATRVIPNDTYFGSQWHLRNTGQTGGTAGADVNITGVWDSYLGDGVTIGIVDDGLHYNHPDLSPNYVAADSWDFVGNDPFPVPPSNSHGTNVAGVAGARGNNGTGVSGAAPNASLAGLRLLTSNVTDTMEAGALSFHPGNIDIYSNSWGPYDSGDIFEGPGPLAAAAIESVATGGRGGLGGIYSWAGGNGGIYDDANRDGYANSRFTISVAAIDDDGVRSYYSETGANHLVSAYSSSGSVGITTTAGSSGYTGDFGGTSSSAPLVSGIIALMLDANPSLTARDVQHILVHTARKNHPASTSWNVNGAGHDVSHLYGFGAVDAGAAVAAAQSWQGVGPLATVQSGILNANVGIPDNNATGVSRSFNVTDDIKLEHVEVILDASHTYRGDLEVFLTSPDGTTSQLLSIADDSRNNIVDWSFVSTHHWDEMSAGTWTLRIADRFGGDAGTFNNWSLNLYGTEATTAPYISEQSFEFDARQAVSISFSQNVSASLTGSDLTVTNQTTSQTIAATLLNYDGATNTATFTFASRLPDGEYTAELTGTVQNGAGETVTSAAPLEFFVLAGDTDRDRDVDFFDFLKLRSNYGTSGNLFSDGDLDYDTDVDFFDFLILRGNYGVNLPPPSGAGSLFADDGE